MTMVANHRQGHFACAVPTDADGHCCERGFTLVDPISAALRGELAQEDSGT